MLVVTEATRVCIENARTIRDLGINMGIGRAHIVANKIRSEKEELLIRASFRRGELMGLVRYSEEVAEHSTGIGASGIGGAGGLGGLGGMSSMSGAGGTGGAAVHAANLSQYSVSTDIKELFHNLLSLPKLTSA
jgi:hypothetical protein